MNEPSATALLLLIGGLLLTISVLASRWAVRRGVPLALLFLLIGMLAGRDGIGGLTFDDYSLTFRVGTVALVLILFDGGLNTPFRFIRSSILPASVLATVGVVLTAGLVATAAALSGLLSWPHAILLGAVVSSTDAAAVFSVLRGSNLNLRKRTSNTLELESGLNDPMAVILTIAAATAVANDVFIGWTTAVHAFIQLAVGAAAGIAAGFTCRSILAHARFISAGLYPVLTVALAMLTFAIPSLMWGSGFLAVYIAAVIIGNGAVPHQSMLRRVHDALAWFSQVGLFLLMGLLVNPRELLEVGWWGLFLALFLAIIARPVAVWLCLLPFKYTWRETTFLGWVGLRGAVPILLATIPVMHGVPHSHFIFNIVFFIVVINAILPGMTVGWFTHRLGLKAFAPPTPSAVLEIDALESFSKQVRSFFIHDVAPVVGTRIADIPFPDDTSALMIVRGSDLITPKGATIILAGDHVYVLCQERDITLLQLMMGTPEE
ncbi:MAG: potassium/proton antiporter [Planctomycetota bacterium]|nr:MAG: potassium/proton antiporter [Planctomycetota bacterium]